MNNLEIINSLEKQLTIGNPKIISQKGFDELVDFCIQSDLRERLWRLALTYSNFNYDFAKIFDFYLDKLDSFYLIETMRVIGDEKSNLKDLYRKVKETKNNDFISSVQTGLMGYCVVNNICELENIIDEY